LIHRLTLRVWLTEVAGSSATFAGAAAPVGYLRSPRSPKPSLRPCDRTPGLFGRLGVIALDQQDWSGGSNRLDDIAKP